MESAFNQPFLQELALAFLPYVVLGPYVLLFQLHLFLYAYRLYGGTSLNDFSDEDVSRVDAAYEGHRFQLACLQLLLPQ